MYPFADLAVVVTGEVPGLDRAAAQAGVVALGGRPVGSVSGKTSLVVVGDGAGISKMSKVRLHKTPVMAGAVFAALVADPGSWDGLPVGGALDDVIVEAEPDPADEVPMRSRDHLVGKTVVYPDGVREVRMSCSCGHRWAGLTLHTPMRCELDPIAS